VKLISRIKGGLGNQLYCYAAARRLSLKNNVQLIIDDVSGFKRDYQYQRKYMLDNFNIPCKIATPFERLEPFERIRRGVLKKSSNFKVFENKKYIEQEFDDYDSRLLNVKLSQDTYIDGLWQSENYFKDIKSILLEDLAITPPSDSKNLEIEKEIQNSESVAVHIRWFETAENSDSNTNTTYYTKAIEIMENMIDNAHYFIFSDNIEAVKKNIDFSNKKVIFINNNIREEDAIWDFWLMSQCKHFILANSTFSWWAAWLSQTSIDKKVIFPRLPEKSEIKWSWDYEGQMPNDWHSIDI
jgi:hypothetical protein